MDKRIGDVSYANQLVYHDLSGRWSFGIYVGDQERVKCMNTEQMDAGRHRQVSTTSHGVYQQCYTSTVLQLSRYDTISIRCLYGSRSVVMQPEFTFWGLVQLSATSHQHVVSRNDGNHAWRWLLRQPNSNCTTVNYLEFSATSNNMKLVHWPLMGGLLHLVQRGGDRVGPQPPGFSSLYQM